MKKDLVLFIDHNLTSPFGYAVHVVLAEKQLPVQVKPVLLHEGEQHLDWYRTLSTTEKIPTLTHGEFSISESLAIVEYLEEVFPAPEHVAALPRSAEQRARARQVLSFLRTEIPGLRAERHAKHLFFGSPEGGRENAAPLGPRAQGDARRLVQLATALGATSQRNMFEEWSVADAELALALRRLLVFPSDRALVPDPVAEYANWQWERPSVRSFRSLSRPPAFVDYH